MKHRTFVFTILYCRLARHYSLPLFIVLFSFFPSAGNAQNLNEVLHFNKYLHYKTRQPLAIEEANTVTTFAGKKTEKIIKTFDEAGKISLETHFDKSGTLNTKLSYLYNAEKRLLSKTRETWTPNMGYVKLISFYSYDTMNFLTRITDKDSGGGIVATTIIKNNQRGNPVEIATYDNRDSLVGKETAIYNYETNWVKSEVRSKEGKIVSALSQHIDQLNAWRFPEKNLVYNEAHDLVSYRTTNPDGSKGGFEQEYTYDKWGNPIRIKIYFVTIRPNGRSKLTVNTIVETKYTYAHE